jgi:Do/DeqQ family serine protease
MNRTRPVLCALAIAATAGLARPAVAAPAAPPRATAPTPAAAAVATGSVADVVDRTLPSVVSIAAMRPRHSGAATSAARRFGFAPGRRAPAAAPSLGSGVIVSRDGYILTNDHVVTHARAVQVTLADGRKLGASIVGTDPKTDLAVLELDTPVADLQPVTFGDSGALRLGDSVLAIGNPFGVGQTVTMGIVSAKERANVGITDYEDFIQTDAAINPGNSGGALVNLRGELVGINTAILTRTGGYQGIGFAIPTGMARPIMDQLIASGHVSRGFLGVTIQDLSPALVDALDLDAHAGVLVSDVIAGSPAARAGLEREDVIVTINRRPVDDAVHLRNLVANGGAGKQITLGIVRDGARREVTVELRPVASPKPTVAS